MLIAPRTDDESIVERYNEWIDDQTQRWGYEPNYAALFASRPDVADAWTLLNLTIRDAMDRRRFELVTVAAAHELRSTYCTAAHALMLERACDSADVLDGLCDELDGDTSDALDETDRELVRFARKVARHAADVDRADIDALRAIGLTDAEVSDVIFAVAARCFFATAVDAAGAQADPELVGSLGVAIAARLTIGRPFAPPR
jgi:uncharacterized peroxidase-related enzyme